MPKSRLDVEGERISAITSEAPCTFSSPGEGGVGLRAMGMSFGLLQGPNRGGKRTDFAPRSPPRHPLFTAQGPRS